MTEIGVNCFMNTALKQINVKDAQIKDVSDWAFYTCEDLKEVALPDGLVAIGDNVFRVCSFTSIK
ncbi:leucine-rich repeat protein [Palleniella muris]